MVLPSLCGENKGDTGFWMAPWCYSGLLWKLLTLLQCLHTSVFRLSGI